MITLRNSLTGKKEQFIPKVDKNVTMYVCGITPYAPAHIGHGRTYVSFDLLFRLLQFLGYSVTYARNFTDIDDKLLNKARELFGDAFRYQEIAEDVIDQYHKEMGLLGCQSPTHEPRVTENIPAIITFIKELIAAGHAYESGGDVYFAVNTLPSYGELSKQQLDQLRAGARIEIGEHKRDPLDFALWKRENAGEFWDSPWGSGRPGWHIECSALASKYLADQIDIHGGGRDLLFPHHENEKAQSEARAGHPFARYWLHSGLVNIDKEKMSKSLGNILGLTDIFKTYDPMELRFYFLLHHYHSPLEFSCAEFDKACKSYRKLCRFFETVVPQEYSLDEIRRMPIAAKMLAFLEDDLNTTGMFGVLFEHLSELEKDSKQAQAVLYILQYVLGLKMELVPEKKSEITSEIQALIEERNEARAQKDWKRADAIRDQLKELGYEVQDTKS